jgi:hypothetical protein
MQVQKTVQVDGFGDGFKAYAYEGKRGTHAGEARIGMRISVADLVSSPELVKALADSVVSFAFSPEQAASIAKVEPQTREALKGAGVKVPATRRAKKA